MIGLCSLKPSLWQGARHSGAAFYTDRLEGARAAAGRAAGRRQSTLLSSELALELPTTTAYLPEAIASQSASRETGEWAPLPHVLPETNA